ncbi:MAG: hypothetical protein ACI9U2_004703 [Bradymonadia bacterium]|jgi:hypothetical protein
MRPRVELVVSGSPDEVLERVRAALRAAPDGLVQGQMGGTHMGLNIREDARLFLSPWLDAHVRPHPEGAVIHGRLMPDRSVWTVYIGMYGVLAMAGLLAGVHRAMRQVIGTGSWGLWIPPLALVLGLSLYASAFLRQSLGGDQMLVLRRFLDGALASPDA